MIRVAQPHRFKCSVMLVRRGGGGENVRSSGWADWGGAQLLIRPKKCIAGLCVYFVLSVESGSGH